MMFKAFKGGAPWRLAFVLGCLLAACIVLPAWAESPPSLRGRIITSSHEINLPSQASHFTQRLLKQDRATVKRGPDGKWLIHFVAFFNQPLPLDHAGVVLLNANGEPVAVASLTVERGQVNLSSNLVVESTDTPGKPHTLQVYYAKSKRPVILAKKTIVLK